MRDPSGGQKARGVVLCELSLQAPHVRKYLPGMYTKCSSLYGGWAYVISNQVPIWCVSRVFVIYQTMSAWKTYKYHHETDELPNPRPTQPKKD